ncbi:hypothetical protein ACFQ0B_51970 [Nonomuraea thailandensis]
MTWEEFPEGGRPLFRAIKTEGVGESMMLDDNAFLRALPGSVTTPMADEDAQAYLRPYPTRRAGCRCCAGPARCRWTASPPAWWPGSRRSAGGWPPASRCPSY